MTWPHHVAITVPGPEGWATIATCPNGPPVWVYGGAYDLPALIDADGTFWREQQAKGSTTVPTHWLRYAPAEPPAVPQVENL